jgi:hypothetical protein
MRADSFLQTAQDLLGLNSLEVAPDVFRSKDGTIQVKMTDDDLFGHGNRAPHVHISTGTTHTIAGTGESLFTVTKEIQIFIDD